MKSTFHGLETARRALSAQQTAIQTTGHNIANANTPGYSRQRVNLQPTGGFPTPGFSQPSITGQLGSGVTAGEITRIREVYLDDQFRGENNKHGYWNSLHESLVKMEDIMNEPTEDGLANMMDRFWQSLQDLSVHPEDAGARSVVRQRGIALSETFNYTYNSLQAVQNDQKNQLQVEQDQINSLLRQVNNINKQIAAIEPHGHLSNDLYDQRDILVDELSQFINVSVEQVGSGGLAKDMAAGRYTIKLLDGNGRDMGVTLVDGTRLEANELHISYDEDSGLVDKMFIAKPRALEGIESVAELEGKGGVMTFDSLEAFRSPGSFSALIESHGYLDSQGNEKGLYPEMMAQLDQMVFTFVEAFNKVHSEGWSLSEITDGEKAHDGLGFDFFTYARGTTEITEDSIKGAAQRLKVHDDIIRNLDNIAASGAADGDTPAEIGFSGDGSNALALANVKDASISFGGSATTNVQAFYQGIIGDMAVNANEAERMTRNSATLRDSVDERRMSVSGVSLDEELTNLIQFQHAYNAAARSITAVDEMLDVIINRMGVVGR
ncbi:MULTISPECIES: flagellar hook-associated protein FlgK [Bacillaceae]|uniref:Flagellar hook-associated protein 1 n=1 Tax=Evansella alkalicola TaxID=745819 RepID=A0ABS6JT40_9BACI|nr:MULTISPECIES: flagellar hook-associated protein FlgK [Bacillaceae]MBU9721729.1 flagellar hook-associated protein FlgK [Bacillus alkalicola]